MARRAQRPSNFANNRPSFHPAMLIQPSREEIGAGFFAVALEHPRASMPQDSHVFESYARMGAPCGQSRWRSRSLGPRSNGRSLWLEKVISRRRQGPPENPCHASREVGLPANERFRTPRAKRYTPSEVGVLLERS